MAEKVQQKVAPVPPTACITKQSKKRKTVFEKATTKKRLDQARSQTRVNIGIAFQRWRQLREVKGLKSDAMVAVFLLDSYEKDSSSTHVKHELTGSPPPAVSIILEESLSDRDDDFSVGVEELDNSSAEETAIQQFHESVSSLDLNVDDISTDDLNNIQNTTIKWEDDTWYPDKELESVSSLEEDEASEVDVDYDDSDDEDYVPRNCVRTGGAQKTQICLDALPTISMEDSVHGAVDNY